MFGKSWLSDKYIQSLTESRSIVGTEQISYTFMVPQYVTRVTEPYAPFPSVGKILAPGLAGDAGHRSAKGGPWTTTSSAPLVTM